MSRSEAVEHYNAALKLGKKYYNACVAKNESPYPIVLAQLLEDSQGGGTEKVGLVDIPSERIVGTWVEGRKTAFAGNFMPLLDADTEFGAKWINLCEAHLDEGGITDPITCLEYMGKFYVQEGHKRVSVLRSYDAPSIPGIVTRILPLPAEDKEHQIYAEFLQFYKASKTYLPTFSQLGGYAKLQAALGFEPGYEWTEDERREFNTDYKRFSQLYNQLNTEKLPLTAGDALLKYLEVHPASQIKKSTADELKQTLTSMWPDIRLLAQGEPISVSTEPEQKEKGLLTRILGGPKLHVAFIYDFDPARSAWASAHERGQKYLEEKMGDTIQVAGYLCGENADESMEEAIGKGANVIFATTPTLMDACRRIAAKHKNVAIYNCSLSLPYTGVRSYYCRIYEGKFITGAISGAMAKDDRIGYVANYPIMGVTAALNAFALGARLTNPRAKIILKWSCLPGNPVQELMDDGVGVISNRDEDGAHSYLTWQLGTYQVNPGGTLQSLCAPRWNWGIFYEKTVKALMNGGIESARDTNHAVTDWWGMNTGVVDVDLDMELPSGVKQLAEILKQGVISEQIEPFRCPIRDQKGNLVNDGSAGIPLESLMRMDWLCDNIEGGIPSFDELLPQSQNLVRLLGIYRETIPPKTEEAAK